MPEQPLVLMPTLRPSTGSSLLAMRSFTRLPAASVSVMRFAIAIGLPNSYTLQYRESRPGAKHPQPMHWKHSNLPNPSLPSPDMHAGVHGGAQGRVSLNSPITAMTATAQYT